MNAAPDIDQITLIGADYSVYTRICKLVLKLKGVPHTYDALDVFADSGHEKARQAGHPFGKIPILRHGDRVLYETLAITRYIDETFQGPPLQPENPLERARMNQIISIVDTQVYPILVWGLHVAKSAGREPEPGILEEGSVVVSVLEGFAGEPWLCGPTPSLADAYLAACMDYILDSAASSIMAEYAPRLMTWWRCAQALPQVS